MKDTTEQDRISKDSGGAICFEMGAVGLMNNFRCIVRMMSGNRMPRGCSRTRKRDSYMDPVNGMLAQISPLIYSFCDYLSK